MPRASIDQIAGEVLDLARLANIVLLHWEGDENGSMDRFMARATNSEPVGYALSIALNATGFGLTTRTRGFRDGDTLDLGEHKLRFMETSHVHRWDSMMVVEKTTGSVFSGATIAGDALPYYTRALLEEQFAYRGSLFGRSIPAEPAPGQ